MVVFWGGRCYGIAVAEKMLGGAGRREGERRIFS